MVDHALATSPNPQQIVDLFVEDPRPQLLAQRTTKYLVNDMFWWLPEDLTLG
jgi:hypothetical protein